MISFWGLQSKQERWHLHVQPRKLRRRLRTLLISLSKNKLTSLSTKRKTRRKNQKLPILCTRITKAALKRKWQECPGTLSLQKRQGSWSWRLLLLQALLSLFMEQSNVIGNHRWVLSCLEDDHPMLYQCKPVWHAAQLSPLSLQRTHLFPGRPFTQPF